MTVRYRTQSALAAGALALLAIGAPAEAQTPQSEAARLENLRQDDLCQLRIGGFIALTTPENNPSQADLELMDDVYAVADRIIYEARVLEKQVGPEAAKRVVDDLLPTWYAGLKHGDGEPNKAAILRADLAPGLRACVARAQTLPGPPG